VITIDASLALDEDYHVHSTWSDDALSTLAENVRVARDRGLRTLLLAEHVRRDSAWVPDYALAVEGLPPAPGLTLLTGVEAKLIDQSGRLDLPDDIGRASWILIADHQFPSPRGPVRPDIIRAALAGGQVTAAEVTAGLAGATVGALHRVGAWPGRQPQLAHLFSVLPKLGLDELAVDDAALDQLVRAALDTGARLEVNEKWGCPSARVIRAFAAAGVPLVASTDSHHCRTIGQYSTVRDLAGQALAGAGP